MPPKKRVDDDDGIIRPAPDVPPPPQRPNLPSDDYASPCFITGAIAGASGGVLGSVFGFVTQLFRHQGPGRVGAAMREGVNSAKAFALLGGVYSAALCYARRLRGVEDAVNSGVAGCATGLVLGWKAGPAPAAQSCVGLGFFSYIFDRFIAPSDTAAHAATMCERILPLETSSSHAVQQREAVGGSVSTGRAALVALQAALMQGGEGELGTFEGMVQGISAARSIMRVYNGPQI